VEFMVCIGTHAWTACVLAAARMEWALNFDVSMPALSKWDLIQLAIVTGLTLAGFLVGWLTYAKKSV
jgi:hypothetical protein